MRMLVTGSRNWADRAELRRALVAAHGDLYVKDKMDRVITVVVGDCPTGADRMTLEMAKEYGWPIEVFHADWDQFKKRAGPIRNRRMVDSGADIAIGFIKGLSVGTRGTLRMCEQAGIPIITIED